MKKIKWKYFKGKQEWRSNYLHPHIKIQYRQFNEYGFQKAWFLDFKGRVDISIPFEKASTAKKVAQLIHNG